MQQPTLPPPNRAQGIQQVLCRICTYVDRSDLKNLRLTSSAWKQPATTILFRKLTTHIDGTSCMHFGLLSLSPLAGHVKELVLAPHSGPKSSIYIEENGHRAHNPTPIDYKGYQRAYCRKLTYFRNIERIRVTTHYLEEPLDRDEPFIVATNVLWKASVALRSVTSLLFDLKFSKHFELLVPLPEDVFEHADALIQAKKPTILLPPLMSSTSSSIKTLTVYARYAVGGVLEPRDSRILHRLQRALPAIQNVKLWFTGSATHAVTHLTTSSFGNLRVLDLTNVDFCAQAFLRQIRGSMLTLESLSLTSFVLLDRLNGAFVGSFAKLFQGLMRCPRLHTFNLKEARSPVCDRHIHQKNSRGHHLYHELCSGNKEDLHYYRDLLLHVHANRVASGRVPHLRGDVSLRTLRSQTEWVLQLVPVSEFVKGVEGWQWENLGFIALEPWLVVREVEDPKIEMKRQVEEIRRNFGLPVRLGEGVRENGDAGGSGNTD